MSNVEEVCLTEVALHVIRKILGQELRPVGSHRKDVILVDAVFYLTVPKEATAQFVKVASFGEKNIARVEREAGNLFNRHFDVLDL